MARLELLLPVLLAVQYVSSQSTDPLGDFNIDALLAELGPFQGGAPQDPQPPGNLGSAVADISTQTGGAKESDIQAAINDIQRELRQSFAADSSLQGLVAGNTEHLGNLDALLSLGGSGPSTATTNSNGGVGLDEMLLSNTASSHNTQSPLALDSNLQGLFTENGDLGNLQALLGSFGGSGSSTATSSSGGSKSGSSVGVDKTRLSNVHSSFDSKDSLGETSKAQSFSSQPIASQNSLEKFATGTHDQHKDNILELPLPNIGDLSLNQRQFSHSKKDNNNLNSFTQSNPIEKSFTQAVGTASHSSEGSSHIQNASPFTAAFSQGTPSVTSQFPDLNTPNTNFDFQSTFKTTENSGFQQSSSRPTPVDRFQNTASSALSFGLSDTSIQRRSDSPSRRQLENLSPDELRRALAEVNKEIDRLSSPINNNNQPSSGVENIIIESDPRRVVQGLDRRSQPLIGLEPGSIAQRFGGSQGLDSSLTRDAPVENSFELQQTSNALTASSPDPTEEQSGPEGQQFVTAARPQINPLNAFENMGGGNPFAQNPFVPGFSQMFGAPALGQVPPMFRPAQLPPNFGQGVPGVTNQLQRFGNTNSFGPSGREIRFEQRRQPGPSFGPGRLRERLQDNRQEFLRSSDRDSRARSPDRDINRIRDSIRQQRLRGSFDLSSLRPSIGQGRSGSSQPIRRLRLNGRTLRRQGHSGPGRRLTGRQPGSVRPESVRRQELRSSWRGRL
uniref:Uncharacterized protein n=1 Tax=Magallana gigas TaxID=29159 RepID=A0A8W8ILD8_MAGGI